MQITDNNTSITISKIESANVLATGINEQKLSRSSQNNDLNIQDAAAQALWTQRVSAQSREICK